MSPAVVLPEAAEPLLGRFCIAFTPRTFQRFLLLFVGSVLALGRHTVAGALWAARTLAAGPGLYTGRWGIEVTFQEVRQHLGFHTPRCWRERSVLRTAPCLLGCWSLVCLIYHRQTRGEAAQPLSTAWYEKAEPTFADAVASVRRLLWSQTVLKQADRHGAFQELPPTLRETLLEQLARAAWAAEKGKSRA